MKLITGIATLVVAILISVIAGYFSIVGLAALFAARALPVIVMGSVLEIGKLVAATWLKFNWADRGVAWPHKGYLLLATLVLMIITSLGIFGFLSAGHLEQNAPLAGLSIQAQQYQTRLDQTMATNRRIEQRLGQIDTNINAFLTSGAASKGLRASETLKRERADLQTQMDANNAQINDLNTKLAPLKQQSTEVEAKLGPVKYLASAAGYDDPEVAVRLVILLIMIAFDPLAVVLMISGLISLRQWRDERVVEAEVVPTEPVAPIVEQPLAAEITPEPEPEPIPATIIAAHPTVELLMHGGGVVTAPHEEIDVRTLLIDLMEEHPEIVTEFIAAVKETELDARSTTNTTGGTID
jgi:hypothetical protein